jgi:hypothetical protein
MNGKTVKFRKLMRGGNVKEASGYRRYVRVDGENIPVIVHQARRRGFWNVSDERTGCSITEADLTPEAALANTRLRIVAVGADRYLEARDKFRDIVLDGVRISGYKGKRVSPLKYNEYQAWAENFRRAPASQGPGAQEGGA